jgi:hypothetical protein
MSEAEADEVRSLTAVGSNIAIGLPLSIMRTRCFHEPSLIITARGERINGITILGNYVHTGLASAPSPLSPSPVPEYDVN